MTGRRRCGRSAARQGWRAENQRLGLEEILDRPEGAAFRAVVELGGRMCDPSKPRTLCGCGYAFELGEQPDDVVVDMRFTIARPLCPTCANARGRFG